MKGLMQVILAVAMVVIMATYSLGECKSCKAKSSCANGQCNQTAEVQVLDPVSVPSEARVQRNDTTIQRQEQQIQQLEQKINRLSAMVNKLERSRTRALVSLPDDTASDLMAASTSARIVPAQTGVRAIPKARTN